MDDELIYRLLEELRVEMQQQINALEQSTDDQITELRQEISSQESAIWNLESQISNLESTVDSSGY